MKNMKAFLIKILRVFFALLGCIFLIMGLSSVVVSVNAVDKSISIYPILIIIVVPLSFIAVGIFFLGNPWASDRKDNQSKNTTKHIKKAPGSNLLILVNFLYSPKIVKEVFEQIVADWRTEYFDALKAGRTWKVRWISVRYTYSFVVAMGLSKAFSLIRSIASR